MIDIAKRLLAAVELLLLFIMAVTTSSFNVLLWIYRSKRRDRSGFGTVKLAVSKPWQQIIVAHFITLTPGTLSIEIDHHNNCILVHFLENRDQRSTQDLISNRVEPLIRKLWGVQK